MKTKVIDPNGVYSIEDLQNLFGYGDEKTAKRHFVYPKADHFIPHGRIGDRLFFLGSDILETLKQCVKRTSG